MAQYDELVEALIWLLTNRVQNKINYSHGLLGDGQGRVRVAGNEDFVYARPDRFSSRTQQIFNKRVEGQDGDPIIIGELPWEPGLTQVISIDWRTYKEIGWGGDTTGFTYHGRTHIWKDAAPGLDTFPVYRRQLGDLQATASVSGTNAVDISSYSIELYGAQKQFPGTIGFPLDNAIPGGTGTARMALLYWDPSSGTTGYVGVATGTTGIDSESTLLNRPVSLPGTLPIAFVRLKAGQAGVTEFDIFDAREPFRPGIGFGTGSSQFHAGLIPISDVGGFYTGTSVESALQEIGGGGGAHAHDASDVSIADAGGYYTGTSVESALQEIGGGSLPGDTFKVSELWESDFGAVAWQTDASGHLSASGKDLTTTGDVSANDITASGDIDAGDFTVANFTIRHVIAQMFYLPGLRGLWPMSGFDEGGNAIDISSQNRSLNRFGNPVYNYDGIAPYLDFDGTGDYLSRGDEAGLDILGTESYVANPGLTVGGWFMFDSVGSSMSVMTKWDTGQTSFLLRKVNTNFAQLLISDGITNYVVTSSQLISAGNWHFMVGRYTPSTELAVFDNGIKTVNTTSIPASITNSNAAFIIGAHLAGASGLLDGRASLCFLCASALSDDQINNLFQQSKVLFGV